MDKQGFTRYLEGKNLVPRTQKAYLASVENFLKWTKVEDIQITKPDILRYLEHLKNRKGLQNASRQNNLVMLSHYFAYLYESEQISVNPCLFLKIRGTRKKQLHKIYTPEELEQLFDAYYQLFVRNYDDSKHRHEGQRKYSALYRERNALIVSILFNQGLITSEIDKIEMNDLDLIKATIRIRKNDRVLPLKATQIGFFLNYLQNIRPKLLEYQTTESEKLFLPLPAISYKKTSQKSLSGIFCSLLKQMKSIDRQFINFHQIRTSVITFWIKTQGLRKAQYLAGHRYICNTEKYITNDLENLTDDINKLHPF
jgi:site-specific recombinase XerD